NPGFSQEAGVLGSSQVAWVNASRPTKSAEQRSLCMPSTEYRVPVLLSTLSHPLSPIHSLPSTLSPQARNLPSKGGGQHASRTLHAHRQSIRNAAVRTPTAPGSWDLTKLPSNIEKTAMPDM